MRRHTPPLRHRPGGRLGGRPGRRLGGRLGAGLLRACLTLGVALLLAVGADGGTGGAVGGVTGSADWPAVGGAAGRVAEPVAAEVRSWLWPLPAPHAIVRPFIAPETPYSTGHRGIDILASGAGEGEGGAVVTAPADGIVHYAGFVVDRPVVSISHGNGVVSSFEPVASTLRVGDVVRAGDPIGTLLPGHCAAPCLHLGARRGGEYVSPLLYLGGLPRSVLLPTRSLA